MSDTDTASIQQEIKRLSKAGVDFDKLDSRLCHKYAEIGKRVNTAFISAVVADVCGGPMVRSTSSDGTPISVKKNSR